MSNIPPNIYNKISRHYIHIETKDKFEDAKTKLDQESCNWDWYLLIEKSSSSILGATFRDIYEWKVNRRLSRFDLNTLINDVDTPMKSIEVIDEDSDLFQDLLESPTKFANEIYVLTWCGEITGIYSQYILDAEEQSNDKENLEQEESSFSSVPIAYRRI